MKLTSVAGMIVVSVTTASAHDALLSESQNQFLFSKYVTNFNKVYEVKDMFHKYAIFKQNLDMILKHNLSGESSFTMGINQFTDLTFEEFAEFVNLNKVLVETSKVASPEPTMQKKSPESIDLDLFNMNWAEQIHLPIKNQGSCGSCWAFAAASTYTYRYEIAVGTQKPILFLSLSNS